MFADANAPVAAKRVCGERALWIPAFAGMTAGVRGEWRNPENPLIL